MVKERVGGADERASGGSSHRPSRSHSSEAMTQRAPAQEAAPAGRTPSETTALLVEFGRAVKARSFYAAGEPEVRLLFSRAWRSFQADLRRHGALELEAAPAWLRVPVLVLRVPNVQLGGLAARLSERGVRTLRFEADCDADALRALVELLAADPDESVADLPSALYERAPRGIVVNRTPAAPALADTAVQPVRSEPEPAPLEIEGSEGDWSLETDLGAGTAADAAPEPPPSLPASFGDAGADVTPEMPVQGGRARAADEETPAEPSDATPVTGEDTDTEAVEADGERPGAADDAEGEDARGAQLEHVMHELAECEDDFQYHDLARRSELLAAALADEGHGDLAYRALVLFARHAGDDGKRTPLQRDAAMDHLSRLATGTRLADLVDRACAPEAESSLEATQVLLRLGGHVVPTLFRAAEREGDPTRRGQIHGILIAMGDAALPEVLRAFESGELPAVRAAARLAGELQSPRAVPPLTELLEGAEPSLRQEAAKALVRIGDARAVEVLARALESPVAGVPNLAAFCLGASSSGRAGEALLGSLRRAVGRRNYEFAAELVRALGRLGRAEATRDLVALVGHRGLRHRKAWRDLKLAATTALGRLPGDEAVAGLAQAARSRDPQLRRAAETALERRAAALRG